MVTASVNGFGTLLLETVTHLLPEHTARRHEGSSEHIEKTLAPASLLTSKNPLLTVSLVDCSRAISSPGVSVPGLRVAQIDQLPRFVERLRECLELRVSGRQGLRPAHNARVLAPDPGTKVVVHIRNIALPGRTAAPNHFLDEMQQIVRLEDNHWRVMAGEKDRRESLRLAG